MKPVRMLWMLALAVPLAAQQPDTSARHGAHMGRGMEMGAAGMGGMGMDGMMGQMREMMGPMMRVMVFSPHHLLMHREVLSLTDQQVAKLTALGDAAKSAEEAARTAIEAHHRALATAFASASPDTTQLKTHFQAMQAVMAKAHWTTLSAAAQARAILTDTQRARADGWADAMEHMAPMMGHGMPNRDSMHH